MWSIIFLCCCFFFSNEKVCLGVIARMDFFYRLRLPQCGSLLLYSYQNFPPELPPKPSLSVLEPLELLELSFLTGSYFSVSVVWV